MARSEREKLVRRTQAQLMDPRKCPECFGHGCNWCSKTGLRTVHDHWKELDKERKVRIAKLERSHSVRNGAVTFGSTQKRLPDMSRYRSRRKK